MDLLCSHECPSVTSVLNEMVILKEKPVDLSNTILLGYLLGMTMAFYDQAPEIAFRSEWSPEADILSLGYTVRLFILRGP